jgi:hypothetical protein
MPRANLDAENQNDTLPSGYEVVHTVTDYWDGPREGVANYEGRPHYYKCLFDEQADEWSSIFVLKFLDKETFDLALEAWSIWLRWEAAYHKGKVKLASHPALPQDKARHEEIAKILTDKLAVNPLKDLRVEGTFKTISPLAANEQGRAPRKTWRVKWSR